MVINELVTKSGRMWSEGFLHMIYTSMNHFEKKDTLIGNFFLPPSNYLVKEDILNTCEIFLKISIITWSYHVQLHHHHSSQLPISISKI